MQSSKSLMVVLVVGLILSIAVTTAGADCELPVVEGIAVDEPSSPYVIYPDSKEIFTKTPLFKFTDFSAYGATKYRIDVWKGIDTTLVPLYTYKGAGDCDGVECTMQPGIPLKPADLNNPGIYTWRIRAKVDGDWPELWDQAIFRVLSSGFTSYFSALEKKWVNVSGTWKVTDAGYMKTLGIPHQVSSVVEKHEFIDSFVYEVKLKRKTELDSSSMIFFNGIPDPTNAEGFWDYGYYFSINNAGNWVLVKLEGGELRDLATGTSEHIKPFDWNKLSVWRTGPEIYLWINNEFIDMVSDPLLSPNGFVGFGMYEPDEVKSPLLVDWARLYYSNTAPYTMP